MPVSEKILTTHDLTIGYGNKVIGREINIEVSSGEIVCLLGQNGVGKSTLLRTLSNLQPSLSGKIRIRGKDIIDQTPQEMARQLGIVTTEKIGASNMTVRELVALGRHPYTNWLGRLSAQDQSKIEDCISLCKIDYIADKKIGDLSDGQRQKAMIARVLAQDTNIILLDEPTAHLDLNNRAEIMKLLAEIKKDRSIVISTHELSLSMQFADRLWLMNFNQPLVSGVPEDLAFSGNISKSFHEQEFEIDILTGNIKFSNTSNRTINLQGKGEAFEWTKHALERIGYTLSPGSNKIIEVTQSKGVLHWNIVFPNNNSTGTSIESLLGQIS